MASGIAAGKWQASLSTSQKFGNDRRNDSRDDRMRDEISPLVLGDGDEIELGDGTEVDALDARDAVAHRKKTAVWALKQKKAARAAKAGASTEQEDVTRPLVPAEIERRLLRAPGTPGAVWTMGEDTLGQCGHLAEKPDDKPYPMVIDPTQLKGGVHGVHAGGAHTLVVNAVGEVYVCGVGTVRAAAAELAKPPESRLAYAGAPPFRVNSAVPKETKKPPTGLEAWGRKREAVEQEDDSGVLQGFDDVLGTDQGEKLAANRYASTTQMVQSSMGRQREQLGKPALLSMLLMPVDAIECGDDFCMALMQNGIVFSWGDGEEGKLGLGRPTSQEKPTMLDFLLPSSYVDTAKQSANKDALLKTGAKVIRKRDKEFQIISVSCGARHTVALSTVHEAFSWGAGGSGQLGHGSYADELLPHPIQAFRSKGVAVLSVQAGAYHSAAIISSTRAEVETHLYTWGQGEHGRLGHGDTARRATPEEVLYHRTKPLRKCLPGRDEPPLRRRHLTDWLSLESGHVLEWSSISCGGRHTTAISKTGHCFTWGSDDDGQLGHGRLVTQRLPALLWLERGEGKASELVSDVRLMGCGHKYTAALTWVGEVFVWGQLGTASWRVPTFVAGMGKAVVVSIACGRAHLTMATGDLEQIEEERRANELAITEAAETQQQLTQARREAIASEHAEVVAETQAAKQETKDEKKRLKVLKSLDKKRVALAKKQGLHKKQQEDEKKEGDED